MSQFFYRCITADLLYIKVKAFRGLRFRGPPLRPSGFGGQAGFTSYPNRKFLPSRLGPRHGELPKNGLAYEQGSTKMITLNGEP